MKATAPPAGVNTLITRDSPLWCDIIVWFMSFTALVDVRMGDMLFEILIFRNNRKSMIRIY